MTTQVLSLACRVHVTHNLQDFADDTQASDTCYGPRFGQICQVEAASRRHVSHLVLRHERIYRQTETDMAPPTPRTTGRLIDMRSDTVTRPTNAMRQAAMEVDT